MFVYIMYYTVTTKHKNGDLVILLHFQEQQTPVPSDDEDGEEVEKAAADTTVVAFTDNLGKLFRSSSQGC